jgi:hypothetical protein
MNVSPSFSHKVDTDVFVDVCLAEGVGGAGKGYSVTFYNAADF